MSVHVVYRCSGCDTTAEVEANAEPVQAGFTLIPTFESAAPEGWMVFDPDTLRTYCPACWESIESGGS